MENVFHIVTALCVHCWQSTNKPRATRKRHNKVSFREILNQTTEGVQVSKWNLIWIMSMCFLNVLSLVLNANLVGRPPPLIPSYWVIVDKRYSMVLYGNCRWSQSTKNPHLHATSVCCHLNCEIEIHPLYKDEGRSILNNLCRLCLYRHRRPLNVQYESM